MLTRLTALTAAGILFAAPAFAVTNPLVTRSLVECNQLVELTRQTIEEQADVGEKAQAEVDRLMVKLQDDCNASRFADADQTAAYIRGLIATE